MRRIVLMASIAFVVIAAGLMAALFASSKTLASSSREIGGASIRFRIIEKNGLIYVSASEQRGLFAGRGWETLALVGEAADIGTGGAEIVPEEGGVRFHVGNKAGRFDGQTRSFEVP
jgi:hypothetical protein